jgi:hypothetical protein
MCRVYGAVLTEQVLQLRIQTCESAEVGFSDTQARTFASAGLKLSSNPLPVTLHHHLCVWPATESRGDRGVWPLGVQICTLNADCAKPAESLKLTLTKHSCSCQGRDCLSMPVDEIKNRQLLCSTIAPVHCYGTQQWPRPERVCAYNG